MKVCTRVSVRWQQIVSVSFEFWGLLKKKAPQTLCSQSFRQAHFCKDGRKTDVFWTKIGALNGRKDGRISQIDGQNHKNTGIRRATFHKHSSRRARLSKDGYLWNTADAKFRLLGLYQARTSPWNQQLRQPWLGNQKNLGGPKGCYCILVPPKFLFYRSSSVYDPPKSFSVAQIPFMVSRKQLFVLSNAISTGCLKKNFLLPLAALAQSSKEEARSSKVSPTAPMGGGT